MATTPSAPQKLRVAAVQMKYRPTIQENLAAIEQALQTAARRRADVVLFPECAVTSYVCDFAALRPEVITEALAQVCRLAAERRINVLVGSPVFRRGRLYNCVVVINREGLVTYCYAKCQLTPRDTQWFTPGNAIALFEVDGVPATTMICHERRYPELVRLAVMAGARVVFHPNAGLDPLPVSLKKRGGRDGIPARAFENAVYYVFANTVGPQPEGKWSAGDSKIVAPDQRVLQLADNENEAVLVATLDLSKATGVYAARSLQHPRFLSASWKAMVEAVRRQSEKTALDFVLPNKAR